MTLTHARVSRSDQSKVAVSATAVAMAERTLAESTSYCCAPAAASPATIDAASAAAALIARRRFRIHEARLHVLCGLGERHAGGGAVAAVLVFDDAILQAALADDDAVRDCDELLVGGGDAGALVPGVEEDFDPPPGD